MALNTPCLAGLIASTFVAFLTVHTNMQALQFKRGDPVVLKALRELFKLDLRRVASLAVFSQSALMTVLMAILALQLVRSEIVRLMAFLAVVLDL